MKDRQHIQTLLKNKEYLRLYEEQAETITAMLLVESLSDFEAYLLEAGDLEEDVFGLYYGVAHGESLLIGGYEGDVSDTVASFLRQRLPEPHFSAIQDALKQMYIDLGNEDTVDSQISVCNQLLQETGYSLQLCYNETYCAGVYFLSVTSPDTGSSSV